MTVFDNPFYILGASMTDDRRRLQDLYDEKSLLVGESCENAFRILTNPVRRAEAELRWFPGSPQNKIAGILSRFHRISTHSSVSLGDLCRLDTPAAPVGELNQLLSLLPFLRAENMDAAVLEASRLLDAVSTDVLLGVINESRRIAGIPLLQSRRDLETVLAAYRDEVCRAFAQSASRMPAHEYDILITRIARFGISPVVEMIIRDYELRVSEELDRLEEEIDQKAKSLRGTGELCAAVLQWSGTIKPLQVYGGTIGSNQMTREREARILNALQVYAGTIVPGWKSLSWNGSEWERYAVYTLRECVNELIYQRHYEECGLVLRLCRELIQSVSGYDQYWQWDHQVSSALEQVEQNKKRQAEAEARQEEDAEINAMRKRYQEMKSKEETARRQEEERAARRQAESQRKTNIETPKSALDNNNSDEHRKQESNSDVLRVRIMLMLFIIISIVAVLIGIKLRL